MYILNVVSGFFWVICFWCVPLNFGMFYTLINIIFSDELCENFNDILMKIIADEHDLSLLIKKIYIYPSSASTPLTNAKNCTHYTELYVWPIKPQHFLNVHSQISDNCICIIAHKQNSHRIAKFQVSQNLVHIYWLNMPPTGSKWCHIWDWVVSNKITLCCWEKIPIIRKWI